MISSAMNKSQSHLSLPTISVLIPAYNRAATIGRCVLSASQSDYPNLQIIVADNGSEDGTADIVDHIKQQDSRIRLIRHDVNRGPIPNWQSCLEQADGDFVHWLWSDDWVKPTFYTDLVAGMHDSGAEMALSPAQFVCGEDDKGETHYACNQTSVLAKRVLAWHLAAFKTPLSPAAALLPMSSVRDHFTTVIPPARKIDCNAKAIGCDALMIAGALFSSESVYWHPEPLVNFFVNEDSISCSTSRTLRGSHYAWARLWWSRQHGQSRTKNWADVLRLVYCRRPDLIWRGLTASWP